MEVTQVEIRNIMLRAATRGAAAAPSKVRACSMLHKPLVNASAQAASAGFGAGRGRLSLVPSWIHSAGSVGLALFSVRTGCRRKCWHALHRPGCLQQCAYRGLSVCSLVAGRDVLKRCFLSPDVLTVVAASSHLSASLCSWIFPLSVRPNARTARERVPC